MRRPPRHEPVEASHDPEGPGDADQDHAGGREPHGGARLRKDHVEDQHGSTGEEEEEEEDRHEPYAHVGGPSSRCRRLRRWICPHLTSLLLLFS